jgi:hypothetical protein
MGDDWNQIDCGKAQRSGLFVPLFSLCLPFLLG